MARLRKERSAAWWAALAKASALQGRSGGGWGDLAGNDLGTGLVRKQSSQNQAPLCSDETASQSSTANLQGQSFREAIRFPLERGVENEPLVAFEPTTSRRLTHGKALPPLVGRRSSLPRFGFLRGEFPSTGPSQL